MTDIRSIVVFGASGNIGAAIVPSLLSAGLSVTVATRPGSSASFSSGVKVATTDYSQESLTSLLQNIDAVVSVVGPQGYTSQHAIIDAATVSGVKYFIPSEFGLDYTDPRIFNILPLFKVKNEVLEHLKRKEKEGLSWTGIVTGLWLDWGLPFGMFDVDLNAHKATIWDGGNTKFRVANVRDIAEAVTSLVLNPQVRQQASNTIVHISSLETTQNEVLEAAEKATGAKFDVTHIESQTVWSDLQDKAARGDAGAIREVLTGSTVSKQIPSQIDEKADKWNALLLNGKKEETVEETVKRIVKGDGPQGKWVTQNSS
ncbi:NAD(P)-binding protein [Lophiostoma macrostomum CBS 122681]|uniref:NAD(P)-binding protein n=1 Tax=Lophiostoma macrostomum CBS 122681 TaxID=1314788 RepID=A0A6A6TA91_9PLEO|nr:NAD(P)-binding protein [Lophiostoma macrostomum CBS 122681]